MEKTRFGIECENFDLFFDQQATSISQPAKESLPKDVLFKLRKKRLPFFGKLYLLWRHLKKRVYVVVEDEENGLTVEQFLELRKAIKARDLGVPKAEGFISTGTFITASKELSDTFDYLNRLSTSPAYNYLLRSKNKTKSKVADRKAQLAYICRFISNYEASKKTIVAQTRLSIPEWYVLLFFYSGAETSGAYLYKEYYKSAYQSKSTRIKEALGTLQMNGYLRKTGNTSNAVFSITPIGIDLVNSILSKYIVNC